jgi:hypothetical protein
MLAYLRHIMIEDARPVAGVFIGGGDDVTTEYGLLRNLLGRAAGARGFAHSGPPLYPIALPGGAAAKMEAPRRLRSLLWQGGMAAVAQGIVQDIGEQLGLAGPGRSGVGLGW